jgi:uncharacterized protein (TIGR00661 family)
MRIAWGVHGYGHGHATRVRALLGALGGRHDVLLFAGADAFETLGRTHAAERIPCLAFRYAGAHISWPRTLSANASLVADLLRGGPAVDAVAARLEAFAPDLVVSDSEPLVLRAAAKLRLPTVGLDHVGVIAWCRPRASGRDRLRLALDGAAYRMLLGRPDRILVSSFYPAPPLRPGVVLVPPILRERVLRAEPSEGRHLLVYFNKGAHLYDARVDAALRALGMPVEVFGAGRAGRDGNVTHRPFDEAAFVDALAGCRAVLATAGHQLLAEAIHLRKPLLVAPEANAEQRLNAREAARLGVARVVEHRAISPRVLRSFVDGLDGHRAALEGIPRRTGTEAALALEGIAAELRASAGPVEAATSAG